ncbi:hypothetical protein PTKIN_Ptkin13bG0021700 [Pterospermum kingtungense]
MIHPSAVGSWNKEGSTRNSCELRKQTSLKPQTANTSYKKDDRALNKDSAPGYVARKTRIHYSGPLMPLGGDIDDILEEHEKQIQQALACSASQVLRLDWTTVFSFHWQMQVAMYPDARCAAGSNNQNGSNAFKLKMELEFETIQTMEDWIFHYCPDAVNES